MLRVVLISLFGLTVQGGEAALTLTGEIVSSASVQIEIAQLGGVALVEVMQPERQSYLVTGDGGVIVTVLDDHAILRALPGSLAFRVDMLPVIAMGTSGEDVEVVRTFTDAELE